MAGDVRKGAGLRGRVMGSTPAAPRDHLGLNSLICKRGNDAPFRVAVNHREATDLNVQTCLVYV